MSNNPFRAHFDSACHDCGESIYEGDEVFAVEGIFVCRDCADRGGNICKCGNFKKSGYPNCFECYTRESAGG